MILLTLILLFAALSLAGCAALRQRVKPGPRIVVKAYVEHISHATQHAPLAHWLGLPVSNYGTDAVFGSVTLEGHAQNGPFVTLAEGVSLNGHWRYGGDEGYGALLGPREIFEARAGWKWSFN
jgi:uncharacterized protein YceK